MTCGFFRHCCVIIWNMASAIRIRQCSAQKAKRECQWDGQCSVRKTDSRLKPGRGITQTTVWAIHFLQYHVSACSSLNPTSVFSTAAFGHLQTPDTMTLAFRCPLSLLFSLRLIPEAPAAALFCFATRPWHSAVSSRKVFLEILSRIDCIQSH